MGRKSSVIEPPVLDLERLAEPGTAEGTPAAWIADDAPAGPIGITFTAADELGDTDNPLALAALAYVAPPARPVPPPVPPAPLELALPEGLPATPPPQGSAAAQLPVRAPAGVPQGLELEFGEPFRTGAAAPKPGDTAPRDAAAKRTIPPQQDNALTAATLVHRAVESVLVRTPRALAAQASALPACTAVLLPAEIQTDDRAHSLLVGLYAGMVSLLGDAADCMTSDRHAAASVPLRAATDILGELQALLDVALEPEIAGDLERVYAYCRRRIMDAHLSGDARPLDEVVGLLAPLRDAWLDACPR